MSYKAILISALCLAQPVQAASLTGAQVSDLVQEALSGAGLSGTPQISSARRYPECEATPEVRPTDRSWQTVEVACASPAWKRVIRTGAGTAPPVAHSVTAREQTVVVLTEPLAEGTLLQPEHLAQKPVSRVPAHALQGDPSDYVGRRLTSHLAEGRPLLARHLEHVYVVTQDAPVAIEIKSQGIAILSAGIAVDSGQTGERIRVRNSSSGRIVRGIVTGANKVRVFPKTN